MFAAASLAEPFRDLEARFEAAHPGVDVKVHAAGSHVLATQILEGAPAAVFASADEAQMARVERAGLATSPSLLARGRLVLVVAEGSKASVRHLADLAKPGVKVVLAGEAVPAGRYAQRLLDAHGEKHDVLARVVSFEDSVTGVLTKVALGEADAGIVYETDAKAARDRVLTIPLPDEWQPDVRYLIARTSLGEGQPLAHEFVALTLAEGGRRVLGRYGFAPASP